MKYLVVSYDTDWVFNIYGTFDCIEDAKQCFNQLINEIRIDECADWHELYPDKFVFGIDNYQCTYQIHCVK